MKNALLILSLIFSTALFAGNNDPVTPPVFEEDPLVLVNGNGNSDAARAMGAFRSACPNATGQISWSSNVVSSCFAGGFITEVYFYRTYNCPPNQICPLYAPIQLLGTVTLGCDGDVINVSCYPAAN